MQENLDRLRLRLRFLSRDLDLDNDLQQTSTVSDRRQRVDNPPPSGRITTAQHIRSGWYNDQYVQPVHKI